MLFICSALCFINVRVVKVSGLIKTFFLNSVKSFKVFETLFLEVIKSLLLLILKALTLKNLTLKNCSSSLSLIPEDLLATTSLTLILIRYITSFTIYTAIVIIKALRLKNIITRKKATNTIITIKRFKHKKVKVI